MQQNRLIKTVLAMGVVFILLTSSGRALALDARALVEDGVRYEHGEGVSQDYGHAYRLYCIAAVQGDAEAAYRLGWMHLNGRGMPEREARAVGWFQVAAERGDPHSRRILKSILVAADSEVDPGCPRHTRSPDRTVIQAWVRALAPRYGIDADLVLAVVEVESRFDPRARSPKNAQGLMQLIPATAQRFAVEDAWDPFQNLMGGMAYLRWLLDYYDGDIKLALAAYNAGEHAVNRYGGIPPYQETRDYVRRIARILGVTDRPITVAELDEISFETTSLD